jgi:hypothetical protein
VGTGLVMPALGDSGTGTITAAGVMSGTWNYPDNSTLTIAANKS